MKLVRTAAGLLALQAALCAQGGTPSSNHHVDDLLFDEISQRWLERNQVGGAQDWRPLLEQRFAHVALGVFDVYLPAAALREGKTLKETGAALSALVDMQRGWAAWVSGGPLEKLPDDPLTKWLKGLSSKQLSGHAPEAADLADATGAEEAVRTALERFKNEQRGGRPFGLERELPGVRLAIFPRRGEFVEFTCVAGAIDPRLKNSAWDAGLTTWLEYEADDTRFLTLEYAVSEAGPSFERGISVGERNPTAILQLVTQVAGRAMLTRVFSGLDPALRSGMANALVIDLYGELDTRIDGDVRSRSSEGSSTFVPGGNPDGGVLPATSAENRWRGTKGKDHFVGILSQVQKQSGKKASTRPEKLTRFELQSDDGSSKELVSAPFLGASAVRPGAEILPDYLELVRCYGIAFLHWLRIDGAGKPPESAQRFGVFLQALGRGVKSEELPTVLREVYGQPLSAGNAELLFDEPTLEGRFLVWLSKQG